MLKLWMSRTLEHCFAHINKRDLGFSKDTYSHAGASLIVTRQDVSCPKAPFNIYKVTSSRWRIELNVLVDSIDNNDGKIPRLGSSLSKTTLSMQYARPHGFRSSFLGKIPKMNNQDFRKLLQSDGTSASVEIRSDGRNANSSTAPGSRNNPGISMTPRIVKGGSGHDSFAHQLASQRAANNSTKKFKSHKVKGTKLAAGYHDRVADREQNELPHDARETRIRALEEQMKLGQISKETFEQLVDQITGGDVEATHLVKGLDRRLLARVRNGEDVLGSTPEKTEDVSNHRDDGTIDEDSALEVLEKAAVTPVARDSTQKKGEIAPLPPKPLTGVKRSRNEILAELRAMRETNRETQAVAESQAASGFKRVGDRHVIQSGASKVERDKYGREVITTIDEEGNVKRKVRKVNPTPAVEDPKNASLSRRGGSRKSAALGSDAYMQDAQILANQDEDEEEDDDIFQGAGRDYDPLVSLEANVSDDTSDSDAREAPHPDHSDVESHGFERGKSLQASNQSTRPSAAIANSTGRNYFAASSTQSLFQSQEKG